MTDWLLSRLPAPFPRILEVGDGASPAMFLKDGDDCRVQRISLDAIKDEDASQGDTGDFNAVLFRVSPQCIEPLVVLDKALDWLVCGGSLLVVGEPEADTDILFDGMVALAGRFGFDLVERENLSATAESRQDQEKPSEGMAGEEKNDISGSHAYELWHFRKKSPPKWRLRLIEERHHIEMRTLFERVFGHPMEPAMCQWKYGGGRGIGIGIWRDSRMVGHYGGMCREILFFGQPGMAAQIGDVMVESNERGVLTRTGPFFLMAATFLERYLGFCKPYILGFGFPELRAMKLAELQGLYAKVGRMVEFTWIPAIQKPKWLTRVRAVGPEDAWAADAVDGLWRQMAEDLRDSVVGVRDWQYIMHRYFSHPHNRYQVIMVRNRFGGRYRSALIMRREQGLCELVDIIAPLKNIPMSMAHARRLAGLAGDTRFFCRITENFADLFEAEGSLRQELDIHIPANIWSHGPSPDVLQGRWWLMSGDTDYR